MDNEIARLCTTCTMDCAQEGDPLRHSRTILDLCAGIVFNQNARASGGPSGATQLGRCWERTSKYLCDEVLRSQETLLPGVFRPRSLIVPGRCG